jgi:hypothetical protein
MIARADERRHATRRYFYAFALFASGAQQVVTGKFVRLVPEWMPPASASGPA